MSFLVSLVPAIIVLGVLIAIHELGHFIACRLTGVKVEKFSIGFGPVVFSRKINETEYALSLLPLGGFVKPAGESFSETGPEGPKKGDYLAAPLLSRIIIVTAGVFMNYVLAYVLFTAIFMMGRPVPGTTIAAFVDGYPAKTSGLQKGDTIKVINGAEVSTWTDLMSALDKSPEGPLQLSVLRGDKYENITLTPKSEDAKDMFGKSVKVKRLGISPDPAASKFEKYGFVESLKISWTTVWNMASTTYKAIFYLATGKLSLKTISGPIGIVNMAGSAMHLGLTYVLQLTAALSISLAVINLLPIPALDGGHLLFLLIEGITRKPVSLKVQERATQAGVYLLLALMVFVVYNDLINLEFIEKIKSIFIKR